MRTPLGRADCLVKVLGELVDPLEVERELSECAGQTLVPGAFAVAAVPDPRAGHVLTPVFAKIIPVGTAENAVAIYNSRTPGFRRLGKPVWIENLPVTELGKVRRAELAALLAMPNQGLC
jgi:acyl-coenzyme A synthetase/AMP-(fatty) acid ligase